MMTTPIKQNPAGNGGSINTTLTAADYRADLHTTAGIEAMADDASWPFFHITPREAPGLCYVALSLLRWKNQYNLVNGQVAWMANPLSGTINRELQLSLYVLVGRVHFVRRAAGQLDLARFDLALEGSASGNTALVGESAVYHFNVDSHLGFLGNRYEEPRSMDSSDVADLMIGGNRHYPVRMMAGADAKKPVRSPFAGRSDGKLSIYPKFYRRVETGGKRFFEVTRQQWLHLEELPAEQSPVFLPSVQKDAQWSMERRALEFKLGGHFQYGEDIFVGTDTMQLPSLGENVTAVRETLQGSLQSAMDGFGEQVAAGITPQLIRIPRLLNKQDNETNINQTLNAFGQHVWNLQRMQCR